MRRLLTSILLFTGLLQGLSAREDIRLTTEEGTVAMLPAAVWNGKEWKQVKWSNSARHTEEEEAALKAGSEYDVEGIILGSDRTVTAHVTVTKKAAKPLIPTIKARPLPLGCVQLTGDNILTRNRDRDIELLLSLDVSQQLYNYHDTYGLPTEGITVSDGWDSPTTKLKGHGTGHWLSALALAYASTADEAHRAQHNALLERMRTAVKTMRMCQERTFVWSDSLGRYFEARDLLPGESLQEAQGTWEAFNAYKKDYRHYGYGYINAIPAQHCALIEAFRPYNNEKWVWAPYYTVHRPQRLSAWHATWVCGYGTVCTTAPQRSSAPGCGICISRVKWAVCRKCSQGWHRSCPRRSSASQRPPHISTHPSSTSLSQRVLTLRRERQRVLFQHSIQLLGFAARTLYIRSRRCGQRRDVPPTVRTDGEHAAPPQYQ